MARNRWLPRTALRARSVSWARLRRPTTSDGSTDRGREPPKGRATPTGFPIYKTCYHLGMGAKPDERTDLVEDLDALTRLLRRAEDRDDLALARAVREVMRERFNKLVRFDKQH
jgi:hypothetical protein